MEKALSKGEIEDIIGKNVNMIRYMDIKDFDNVNQLFINNSTSGRIVKPYSKCLLHFQTNHNNNTFYGHWTALYMKGNKIFFFDPYGDVVDDQLDNIDPNYNMIVNQDYPYLSKLLHDSKYNIYYNPYRLQKLQKGINTCGRWCAIFLKYINEYGDIDDFVKVFKNYKKEGYDLDELIVYLTDYLL